MSPILVSLIIFFSLLIAIFLALPVTFCLMGVSIVCYLVFLGPQALFIATGAMIAQISIEVYLAIPLFIFMAAIMQNSGVGRQIYDNLAQWMGPFRGGLAIATVGATTLIAALSGIGATGTSLMGMVALPEMYKYKYHKGLVLGSIAAGGALGPLIPPSVLMIVVAGYTDLSAGKLFLGGFLPGFLVAFFYCIYIAVRCYIRPEDGPALQLKDRLPLRKKIKMVRTVFLPIILALAILVSIYAGVCTPTEAGGVGAFGAILIMIINREFKWSNIKASMEISLKINAMVMWILMGGGCYSALVSATGTGKLVSELITSLSLGPNGTLIIMLIIPFVMGMFIDPVAIVMICAPIFMVIVKAMGFNLLWVMLLFIITVVIGYISPPFGVNLFYMKGVAPQGTKMMDIYKGIIPFVAIKVLVLILCIIFPGILLFLPSLLN